MLFYTFPFGIVPKNSKIVLYAAGVAGNQYYKQVVELNYCEILLWVDKFNFDGVLVKDVSKILELSCDDFDYVVIALPDNGFADEAIKLLMSYGIKKEKIVRSNHSYKASMTGKMSQLSTNDLLTQPQIVKKSIIQYFYESSGDIDYFLPLINEIKLVIESDDDTKFKIIKSVLAIIHEQNFSAEATVVLLYILFYASVFSKSLIYELVNSISRIGDLSLKHWLIVDCAVFWFYYPNLLYNDFFIDLKKAKLSYVKQLGLRYDPPQYVKENNKNICVITFSSAEQIMMCISPVAKIMKQSGYDVHVIDLNSFSSDCGFNIVRPLVISDRVLNYADSSDSKSEFFSKDMHYYSIVDDTMKNRQQKAVDLICAINPLCVFDFTDECSSISYYFSQTYPTIYFPTRCYGGSSFFHRFGVCDDDVKVYPPTRHEQLLMLPKTKEYVKPLRTFERREFGFFDDDFVMVTVGSRLDKEISNSLSEQMCNLLLNNNRIKWLIVGASSLDCINGKYPDLIGRNIVFIDYEKDLSGLYGVCDIFINPDREGGGTTIILAMQQSLAIVSSVESSSGVQIIGKENCLISETEFSSYIKKMFVDATFLKQEKRKSYDEVSKWTADRLGSKLIAAVNELVDEF